MPSDGLTVSRLDSIQMNRTVKILLLIFFQISAVQFLSAKENTALKVSGGPSAGLNYSNFIVPDLGPSHSIMQPGFKAGGFIDLGISDLFSVQFELHVIHCSSDFKYGGNTGVFRYWGIRVPIYAMFHFHIAEAGAINAGIGPFSDFGTYAKYTENGIVHNIFDRDKETGLSTMRDNYSGFSVKAGYEFRCGLQINFVYQASITNVLDPNTVSVRMYPQEFSLELAWRF